MPWCSKKRLSSVAISASTRFCDMSRSFTQSRLARLKLAISLPSADITTLGCSSLAFLMSPMLGVKGTSTST